MVSTGDLTDSIRGEAVRTSHVSARVLAIVFVASFALDFKGNAGGTLIQYGMAVINTLAFALLGARYRFVMPGRGASAWIFWPWLVFLVVGSIGAALNGVELSHYIRTLYPFVLFMEAFLVAWWFARSAGTGWILMGAMRWSAVVSVLFTLGWGFFFTGNGVGSIRYQIVSPIIPFLIIMASYDLFFAKQRRLMAAVLLMLVFGIIGMSVTRGFLLIIVVVAAVLAGSWLINTLKGQWSVPKPFARAFLWGIVIGVGALIVLLVFYPEVLARWGNRSFGPSHDATLWTRVAAAVGQWDQLSSNPLGWAFGQGFGHSYEYAARYASLVLPYWNITAFDEARWFPGEFMWITPIYYSGFFAGCLGIVALVVGAVRSVSEVGILLRYRQWLNPAAYPAWIGALSVLGFLALTFTANPFIFRLSSMFLGLSLGLAIRGLQFVRKDSSLLS